MGIWIGGGAKICSQKTHCKNIVVIADDIHFEYNPTIQILSMSGQIVS